MNHEVINFLIISLSPFPNTSTPAKHGIDHSPGGETRCSRASKAAQRRRATREAHNEGRANGEGSSKLLATEAISRYDRQVIWVCILFGRNRSLSNLWWRISCLRRSKNLGTIYWADGGEGKEMRYFKFAILRLRLQTQWNLNNTSTILQDCHSTHSPAAAGRKPHPPSPSPSMSSWSRKIGHSLSTDQPPLMYRHSWFSQQSGGRKW